jgi:hypothetical protein
MDKPVMKSIHEFADYLALHLGMVRNMRRLSRDDAFFVALDKTMGERWVSVINGNCPTREQREAALQERLNVASLYPRIRPATVEMLVLAHSLQAYANALPAAAAGTSGGWEVRADLLHPDATIKMITAAMNDAKGICALDGENAYFKSVLEQMLEMARWTRTSLNPSAEDRAKVRLGEVTQERLDHELQEVLKKVCRSMHDFCELYANFPTLPPRVKVQLEPLPWDKK